MSRELSEILELMRNIHTDDIKVDFTLIRIADEVKKVTEDDSLKGSEKNVKIVEFVLEELALLLSFLYYEGGQR